jgi:hypothetical protein
MAGGDRVIELIAPQGFQTNAFGAFTLSDGTPMRPAGNGVYFVADEDEWKVTRLLQQGWRKRSDIEREQAAEARRQREERERERQAKAMPVTEILEFVERAGGEVEVRDNKLYARGISSTLRYVLHIRRNDIVAELSNNRGKRWEIVE